MERARVKKVASRFIQQLGLTSIVIGIAAALIKSWATYWLGPPSAKPDVSPPAAVTALVPARAPAPALTLEDLLQSSPITLLQWQTATEARYANETQRERAFREYLGREVVWEGYFDRWHRVTENASPDRACTLILYESRAALYSEQPLPPPSVRCWIPESAAGELAALKRGQWVVVRGTLGNPALLGTLLCTDLEDCRILAARDVRKVDQAWAADAGATIVK